MSDPPAQPKIYHITHVDNLAQIIVGGELVCDAEMIRRGGPAASIGMAGIKHRRLNLPVRCHPGDVVGDYVPFYFCPRSVMLYLLYRSNHSELTYRGGQGPIVHLEADLGEVVAWADADRRRWAFTLSNAGAWYAEFRAHLRHLPEIDWDAVQARDWRDPDIKEAKQAEFLVHHSFPWELVSRIGVQTPAMRRRVDGILTGSAAKPLIEVRADWYY